MSSGVYTVLLAALVGLVVWWSDSTPVPASGQQQPSIHIDSFATAEGEAATVAITALDVDVPPLGAWQMNILYDESLLTPTACVATSESAVCNLHYEPGVVRLAGVAASGVRGDLIDLASIDFTCDAQGEAALRVTTELVTDTNGFIMPHTVHDGTARCTPPSLAATGGGRSGQPAETGPESVATNSESSSLGTTWLVAGGAVLLGLVGTSVLLIFRRRRRHQTA